MPREWMESVPNQKAQQLSEGRQDQDPSSLAKSKGRILDPQNHGKINHILIPRPRFDLWRVFQKTHHKIHDVEGINHTKK